VAVMAVTVEEEGRTATKWRELGSTNEWFKRIAVVKPTAKATPTTDAVQKAGIHTTVKANAPTVVVKKEVSAAAELTAVITVFTVIAAHHC